MPRFVVNLMSHSRLLVEMSTFSYGLQVIEFDLSKAELEQALIACTASEKK
jgi:hypothetical protein